MKRIHSTAGDRERSTAGSVTSFISQSLGTGYSLASGLSTTGGSGEGLVVNIASTFNLFGPAGITLGPDGNVWFTASAASNVIQVTPAGLFTAFPVPSQGNALFVTAGPDGSIWYTDNLLNTIGRLTLPSGAVTEFPTPTSGSGPGSIGVGPTVQPVPAPPTAVTGSNPFGSPVISWTASTSSNVTGYNVYRSTGQNGPFVLLGTTTSTTFTDSNPPAVNCGTNTFYYVVTTVETGNTESANSTR